MRRPFPEGVIGFRFASLEVPLGLLEQQTFQRILGQLLVGVSLFGVCVGNVRALQRLACGLSPAMRLPTADDRAGKERQQQRA
jgi:hypothetical protein